MLRTSAKLTPDASRVIARRFLPGGEKSPDGSSRIGRIAARVIALSQAEVVKQLEILGERFSTRHRDLRGEFEDSFADAAAHLPAVADISREQRLLIGAYFTHEYSIESAALSNPSIVAAPDQNGVANGATRFVLSLRSIGEGHISSIEFRTGVVSADGDVAVDLPSPFAATARHQTPIYDKHLFCSKLIELRAYGSAVAAVLDPLPEKFSLRQLDSEIRRANEAGQTDVEGARVTRTLHWLASSNYDSAFAAESPLSERVLFPAGPAESNGMEDARFVRFTGEDNAITYYATYTAYDGYQILPQLIETSDFVKFRMATLNGPCARNKGIALFPRKIDGKFVALGRMDNENNFLLRSDNVRFWHDSELIQRPHLPWEFVQIGNCGSPIETEAGWLVITHGVGAMRQYALGAMLLDLKNPSRVIGHLAEPLLEPSEDEREGYVPNVVYSCGSMVANGHLILPYGYADVGTRIATMPVAELLARFHESPL